MAYTRAYTVWKDYPDTSTPVTAAKLQHIEDGIAASSVFFNVKDAAYGAKCDGVTDDLAAIHAARDAAYAAGGGTVVIPGTCGISNAVNLSATPKVCLAGLDGLLVSYPGVSVLKALAGFPANTPLVKVAPSAVTDMQTTVRDLCLDGNSLAQDGLYVFDASGVYGYRVAVRSVLRDGVHIDATTASTTSNQEFIDCYVNNPGNAGYSVVKTIYSKLVRCHADGGVYNHYVAAVNLLLDSCHSEGASNTGVYFANGSGSCRAENGQIVTSVANANGLAVVGATSTNVKVVGYSLAGRTSAGTSGTGVSLNAAKGLLSSSTVSAYDTSVTAGAANVLISSNILDLATTTGIRVDVGGGNTAYLTSNIVTDAATSVTVASGSVQVDNNNAFSGTVPSSARPAGYVFTYDEYQSNVIVTATTEAGATTVKAATAVTFDGGTVVDIDFYSPYVDVAANAGGNAVALVLYDGASSIGLLGRVGTAGTALFDSAVALSRRLTPSAAAHTYSVRAFRTNANSTVTGGAGGSGADVPGFVRIRKAV